VPETGEPHLGEPLELDLGEGRRLLIEGRIDRIDTLADGSLVLRDYKTGRAPRDDGTVFRPGVQLQIPIYLLAAARILPGRPVARAFLDYVDGGRQIGIDPGLGTGEGLARLLRNLVDGLSEGLFPQEPAACDFCDFTQVCGPQPLLQRRREIKRDDPRLARHLRFREGV
jgi:RecB family exonuclease